MKAVISNWMTIGITVAAIVGFLGGTLWSAFGNVSNATSAQITNGAGAINNATNGTAP